jgi:integrase
MAVLTNVFRRGVIFHFRARVPASLRDRVGRNELWRSLKTAEPAVARRRGGTLHSLTEALWRDLQLAMTEREVQALVDGWLKAELDKDADVRLTGDFEAIDAHEAQVLRRGPSSGLPYYDPSAADRLVDELIAAHGLTLAGVERDGMIRLMRRAHADLFKAVCERSARVWEPWREEDPAAALVARLQSAPTATPEIQNNGGAQAPTPKKLYGLLSEVAQDAINGLEKRETWRPKRRADYETAVATLTLALGGDPEVGEITPAVAGRFARDLTNYPSNVTKRKPYRDLKSFRERIEAVTASDDRQVLDPVTINGKYLTPLRQIFEWHRGVEPDLANPFEDINVPKPKRRDPKKKRRDFTKDEITRLFSLPMFVGSEGPSGQPLYERGQVKIDDWRVWVPLIAFFTGMRLNEACGLAVADIRRIDDVDLFHVRDEVEGQSLKSIAARRMVPIHDELIDLGFLRFVGRQRAAGRTRLFEELEEDEVGYFSTGPSQWLGRLIDRIEDDNPDDPGTLTFHSTRHTVVTRLRVAGVPEDVRKEIVGHEQGEVHGGYGSFPLPLLKEAVNKIAHPGLNLSRVRRS